MKRSWNLSLVLVVVYAATSLLTWGFVKSYLQYQFYGTWETGAYVTSEVSKQGTIPRAGIPRIWHVRNRGGRDGAGLCVYASAKHSGLVHQEPVFTGMFEWMFQQPGGSYPSKFKKSVETYAREKGLSIPRYLSVERADWEFVVKAAASGRPLGVTYSHSPTGRYGGSRISHMVSLCHASESEVAILDNNYPGSYEWMTPEVAKRVGVLEWVIVLLTPGRPPVVRP